MTALQTKLNIETVAIELVKPYWRNPRVNDAALEPVKQSIQKFGFNQPLVVDAKGVIIVGHTRYRALMELGATEVPIIKVKLSKAKAAEYRIADNKTAEFAQWDNNKLIDELRSMTDAGEEMAAFFGGHELADLLRESSGDGYNPVTEEQMDRVLDKQAGGMAALTKPKIGNQIKLECPHCGEEFSLGRSSIEDHPGEE